MKWRRLDELRIAAAWESSPPCAPWRRLTPVFILDEAPSRVLWPTDIEGDQVSGYEEPAQSLEIALAEGRAVQIPECPRAQKGHELIRRSDGTFAIVLADKIIRSRSAEIKKRLGDALRLLEEDASLEAIEDAFDGAYLVAPLDPVATILRAGIAAQLRDRTPEWFSQCINDLEYAVEVGGDLVLVRNRPLWNHLPSASLREALFRSAREALDDHLLPRADLELPADRETQCAAVATSLWRRKFGRTATLALPHAELVAVLAGDPDAVGRARPVLKHDAQWRIRFDMALTCTKMGHEGVLIPEDVEGTATAHAKVDDLERFARTLYQLEQLDEGPARSASWRTFLQRMQGLDRWHDNRPWRVGELAAEELRSRLDLDGHPIPAMSTLVANSGIFAGFAALTDGAVDAAAAQPRNVPPCMFVNERTASTRHLLARFALAHELCHLLVDRSRTGVNAWVCQTAARPPEHSIVLDAERRANAFAAYLLAPREAVRSRIPNLPALESTEFIEAVLSISRHFGLTATAAAEHLVNCHQETGSIEPGRDKLPGWIRAQVEQASKTDPVSEFEADRVFDTAELGPAGTRMRRGRFAVLVRRWVRSGELSRERAASLLGVDEDELKHWIEVQE